MIMSSPVNETLIRDVVAEVLGRLGSPVASRLGAESPAPSPACGCGTKNNGSGGSLSRGKYGVFQDAGEACEAARAAYRQLQEGGVAARAKVVEIIKAMAEANA